jgi:ribonuclease BN (tRNA processing enzyme)
VQLIVLGAGPAYTDRLDARGASYLLRSDGASLLLDIGQGAFPALVRELEPSGLGAVAISHLHPDHFIDLVPLRHYLRYEFDPPRRVTVHAPAELGRRIDALHADETFTSAALDVVALRAGTFRVGPFEIDARRVTHTDDSYAFRVTDGTSARGVVYSGDCGRAGDLVPLIQPGDTLLAEVSFGPGPVPAGALHLDGDAVGRLARDTNAGAVLLTHLQMGYDREATLESVRRWFTGPTRFVEPADRITLDAPVK